MLEVCADEKLPCLCGRGNILYEMCENENLFIFGTMKISCPHCSQLYKIEFEEGNSPFEEHTFYLVPRDKSIHGDNRKSVLKKCIRIPTPNFEDSKEDEMRVYKEICAKQKQSSTEI